MTNEDVYLSLETKFVTYKDLTGINVVDNGEEIVLLSDEMGKWGILNDMKSQFPQIPVRLSVANKLVKINNKLKQINPAYQLVVSYGFRSMEVQTKYFEEWKEKLIKQGISNEELNEQVHRIIAVPEVAGHPTGGAVDIYIFDKENNKMLDFGTELYNFDTKDVYVFSPFISESAKKNRSLLRKLMMEEEFAPFDGEWWHFSYGDKEWAFYYKKNNAIYKQKKLVDLYKTKV